MHPGLSIQYLQIIVGPLQQRLLLVRYLCRRRCGQKSGLRRCDLSAGELAGKDFCRQPSPPATASSTYHRPCLPVRGCFVYETTASGPSGCESMIPGRARYSSWRPDAGPNSSNSSIGASPMHVATSDTRQSNATPWNTIEMPSPRASQGTRVYKTAQTVLA